LVVIIILGILLAIAVPSYLSFKDRANKSAAQANVRAVLPDVESYNADNVAGALAASDPDFAISNADNGYQGMTAAELKLTYDQAFPASVWIIGSADVSTIPVAAPTGAGITAAGVPTATNYCIVSQNGSWYAWKHGPGGTISVSNVLANVCAP
jgi:type IV pilus assembly protein PilA